MYEILPHLYLSNFVDAKDVPRGFFVINCTKNLPMVASYGMRLPVNDDLSDESIDKMTRSLPVLVDQIDNVITSGGDVLVHCAAGQQRSAAVVVAYLVYRGMTREGAIEYVKSKKPDAFLTGVNFDNSLKDFETRI
jgi:protein-tyrosine phosphatase